MIYEWEATCKLTLARDGGARDSLADAKQAAEAAVAKLNTPKYRLEIDEIDGDKALRSWVKYAASDWMETE